MDDAAGSSMLQHAGDRVRHTLTVKQVWQLLFDAGVARSERRIKYFCQNGTLDAGYLPSPTGDQWYVNRALHTKPKSTEWESPRMNALGFLHYLNSYGPIFKNSITTIKPGIEDLQKVTSNIAAVAASAGGYGRRTAYSLDDGSKTKMHGGVLPYKEAVEEVNRAAKEAMRRWESVITAAEARAAGGFTPRVLFGPLTEFDKDEDRYKVLSKTAECQDHRRRLKAAWEQDLTWLFDLNSSAIGQIADAATREKLLNKTDWKKVVYVGKDGDSAPAAKLFNAIAELVPERRVPSLVPLINVDKKVETVPGTKQKLFPEAKNAFVAIRDAAAATHTSGGTTGITIDLASGWRSAEHQADLASKHPNRQAVAGKKSAHRYGLAADINLSVPGLKLLEIDTSSMTNVVSMYRSPIYKWMFLYGAQFGWYPYRNEPWHWEYNPPGFPERFAGLAKE